MRHQLPTKIGKGRSIPLSPELLVNMYAERAPDGAKSQVVVHGVPGFTLFTSISSDKIRGLYRTLNGSNLYVVIKQTLYSVNSAGSYSNLGTISGSGLVFWAESPTEILINAGAQSYTYNSTEGLELITDPDFPGASSVTFLDQYFIFTNNTTGSKDQFFISSVSDGETYDALDFATAENYPDNLVRVFADHNELYLFGTDSIEIWFNAGNADFPFAPAQGSVIEDGLGAAHTVEKVDESIIWLSHEGIVRRLEGSVPVRISDHAVEHLISKGDWTNAYSYSYTQEGHQFYVLTIPAANNTQTAGTYVYDAATRLWHQRKSYELDYSRIGFYARVFGKHIVGDVLTGKLYELSLDVYQENGDHLIAEMHFPQIQNDGDRFVVHKFQLDMEVGLKAANTLTTQGFGSNSVWTSLDAQAGSNLITELGFHAGTFLAVGDNGFLSKSTDGLSWTAKTSQFGTSLVREAEYGNGVWLICGDFGKRAISTDDGETFTLITAAPTRVFNARWNGSIWVMAGLNGLIQTSTDNTTWTTRSSGLGTSAAQWPEYGQGKWLVVGADGKITKSVDNGITWSLIASSSFGSSSIFTIGFNGTLWLAGGASGKMAWSNDGDNWNQITSGFGTSSIFAIYNGDNFWIAVGEDGKIGFSSDGKSWTQVTTTGFGSNTLSAAVFGNGKFFAAGDNGSISYTTSTVVTSSTNIEPQAMLRVSSNTRTNSLTEPTRSIGKIGEYEKRVIWRRLGQHRSFTPIVRISDPAKRAVFTSYVEIEGNVG